MRRKPPGTWAAAFWAGAACLVVLLATWVLR